MTMIRLAHRWMPGRAKVFVVDGGYAAIKLAMDKVEHEILFRFLHQLSEREIEHGVGFRPQDY
jgi:hypothetical protein